MPFSHLVIFLKELCGINIYCLFLHRHLLHLGCFVLILFLGDTGFRIRIFFFADPGKNLHADPDPDPGVLRGRGLGGKGKK